MASLRMSAASFGSSRSQIAEDDVTQAVEEALQWVEGHMGDNGSVGYTDFVNALPLLYTLLREEVMLSAGEVGKSSVHLPTPALHTYLQFNRASIL